MNFSNINMLSDAYVAMRSLGLVDTKAEFSTAIIGKGASYLTSTVAKGREPPDTIIARLRERLVLWESSFASNTHCGAAYALSVNERYTRLVALRRLVEAHIATREAFAMPDNIIPFRRAV